jgi:hypothetical protein
VLATEAVAAPNRKQKTSTSQSSALRTGGPG